MKKKQHTRQRGRPLEHGEPLVPTMVRITDSMRRRIDGSRGGVPVAAWIRDAIAEKLTKVNER